MRLYGGVLGVSGLLSGALLVIIYLRKNEEKDWENKLQFQQVRLKITGDMLKENQHELIRIHNLMDKNDAQMKVLTTEVNEGEGTKQIWQSKLETCRGEQKNLEDDAAFIKSQLTESSAKFEKEWIAGNTEVTSLKQLMTQRSKLCDFVTNDSKETRKLCGTVVPKENPKEPDVKKEPEPEKPKPEEPIPEEPKGE